MNYPVSVPSPLSTSPAFPPWCLREWLQWSLPRVEPQSINVLQSFYCKNCCLWHVLMKSTSDLQCPWGGFVPGVRLSWGGFVWGGFVRCTFVRCLFVGVPLQRVPAGSLMITWDGRRFCIYRIKSPVSEKICILLFVITVFCQSSWYTFIFQVLTALSISDLSNHWPTMILP